MLTHDTLCLENVGDAVVNVYINQEKKFAFVEMRTVEEASNAMALDGIIFEVFLSYGLGPRVEYILSYVFCANTFLFFCYLFLFCCSITCSFYPYPKWDSTSVTSHLSGVTGSFCESETTE